MDFLKIFPGLKAISYKITLKNIPPDHWQKLREFCPNKLVTKKIVGANVRLVFQGGNHELPLSIRRNFYPNRWAANLFTQEIEHIHFAALPCCERMAITCAYSCIVLLLD